MHKHQLPATRLSLLIGLLLLAPASHAYLDPNTGGMILSAIVGIFATVTLALKTYWYRLKGFLRRLRKQPDDQPAAKPAAPAPAEPGQRHAD